MKLLGIYGASGFGREVMPLLRQQVQAEPGTDCVFVDDASPCPIVNGSDCLSFEAFLSHPADQRYVVLAIADAHTRAALAEKCTGSGIGFTSIRAQNSIVLDEAVIGEGLVLCPFAMITSNVTIGCHFHANIYSYVGHDCMIGDFVTLAPGAKVNGNVTIGEHAYIGTGAMIRQGITIGAGATVGMGAVVTRDVPPGATFVGNPAKPLIRA
jgi:sugar O-acyltransferase (sialic acid O-acetyltransferase NeuD family)